MKRIFFYILVCVCVLVLGCRTQQITQYPSSSVGSMPDTMALPSFSSEMLYVLGARWEANEALQEQTIAEYIEQELVRLYPEKAYRGYIDRLCATVDGMLVATQQRPSLFLPEKQEITFNANTNSPYALYYALLDSLSQEKEMELLELTPDEQADWDQLQLLAYAPEPLTREAFDTLDIAFFEEENILLTLLLWRGPRLFYRVLQSKARAEKLARYYYDKATNNGRPGDAFKHIYVNVLMRTYVGEWLTHAVMDVFWEWRSPNAPCDHFMDLHNNIIGRDTRYADFTVTDRQCGNTRHWLQWAENVQHFVQDAGNSDYQEWDKETPTFIVESAAKQVSKTQYIYWGK